MLSTKLKIDKFGFVSNNIFKNISISLVFKGLTILGQLYLIPLTLQMLNKEAFGVWITMSTIINWFTFFDFGLGNGLRNKLVKSLSNGDLILSRRYVSTFYVLIFFICIVIALFYTLLNEFFPLCSFLFKVDFEGVQYGLSTAVYLFVIRFFMMSVVYLNYAVQKSSNNDLLHFTNIFVTVILLTLTKLFGNATFINIIVVYSIVPICTYSIYSLFFFMKKKDLFPSVNFFQKSLVKNLMGDGMSFFFIQIVSLLLFTFPVILIGKFYGSSLVTDFNISNRLYGVVYMLLSIILTPFWSAITKAAVEENNLWIKNVLKKLQILSYVFVLFVVIIMCLSPYIYSFWINDDFLINHQMNWALALFNIVLILIAPLNYYLNGKGLLKLQVQLSFLNLSIYFPACFILSNSLNLGAVGIVYSSVSLILINYIVTFNALKNQK